MTRFALIAAASAFCVLGAQAGEDISFEDVDTNGDGFVTETEFVSWKTASGEVSTSDALTQFIAIDADASGMISPSEMEAAMAVKDDDGMDDQDDMTAPEDPLN
jgi:Ca2+-binding EF-hand superfamily protein